jgi:hypothetical protein
MVVHAVSGVCAAGAGFCPLRFPNAFTMLFSMLTTIGKSSYALQSAVATIARG